MFYTITDGKLYEYGDKSTYFDIQDNILELTGITEIEFQENINKYEVKEGLLVDISATDEYKEKALVHDKAVKKANMQSQVELLDLKCIRALREGGIYDTSTGQTWLEYYTEKIFLLREEMASL